MTKRVCTLILLAASTWTGFARAEEPKYDVVLLAQGDSLIQTVKVVRENAALDLKTTVDLVKNAPKTVKSGMSKEDGEKFIKALDALFAKAELRDASGKVVATTTIAPVVPGKFDLILKSAKTKLAAIRVVQDVTGLGLPDAKTLVESAPVTVKSGMTHEEAQKFKRIFTSVEAEAEVKESK